MCSASNDASRIATPPGSTGARSAWTADKLAALFVLPAAMSAFLSWRSPLSVIGSGQGPALGSAIHAAVAAGAYPDVPAAAAVMGREQRDVYQPDPVRADVYDELYAEYVRLHDYFGRGENKAMYRLRAIRDRVLSGRTA